MARVFYLLLLILPPWVADCANEWFPIGAKSTSMGFTSVTQADLWSVHNNQAAMAFCNRTAIGAYFENRFMIRELGYHVAAIVMPTRYGSFGGNVLFSGDQNMNQWMAGFGYSRKFGENFSAGLQLDYLKTFLAEGYGLHRTMTFEGGILARISKELSFGIHIFNPVSAKLSTYSDERIPMEMNGGLNYRYSEKLNLSIEAVKRSYMPWDIRAGAEYQLFGKAFARGGICTHPFQYTAGCGVSFGSVIVDFSASVHHVLGFSPQISIQYLFHNKTQIH